MSKAILILDMPESCDVCDFEDRGYCGVPGIEENIVDYIACRPNWCPLRELPDRKSSAGIGEYNIGYNAGWNECLDEIMSKI